MKAKNNNLGYCPDCFSQHGNTVEDCKPHGVVRDYIGGSYIYYKKCIICGKKVLAKKRICQFEIAKKSSFNYEDYKLDLSDYTE